VRVQARTIRKRRSDLLGVALIVATLAVVGALALMYWRASGDPTDRSTMCPNNGPEGLTVFVVDATDAITAIQRASLHNHFEQVVTSLPARWAIELFTVEPVGTTLLHRAGERICNPGRESNFWTQNPRLVEKRWHDAFWEPLQQWEAQVIKTPSAGESPILESLQSIAVTEFQTAAMQGRSRKLVIVSDMLQHTNGLSQYQTIQRFADFSQSSYYKSVHTDWTGVDVEILYITRPGTPQGRQHIEFWQQYFAASGGTVTHVTSL
jgi:hypothetical protein